MAVIVCYSTYTFFQGHLLEGHAAKYIFQDCVPYSVLPSSKAQSHHYTCPTTWFIMSQETDYILFPFLFWGSCCLAPQYTIKQTRGEGHQRLELKIQLCILFNQSNKSFLCQLYRNLLACFIPLQHPHPYSQLKPRG